MSGEPVTIAPVDLIAKRVEVKRVAHVHRGGKVMFDVDGDI
jgi:hypothetical protein